MGKKHWEKEKLLITSNFSFSHSVFKSLVLQTRKNQGLFGKGLNQDFLDIIRINIFRVHVLSFQSVRGFVHHDSSSKLSIHVVSVLAAVVSIIVRSLLLYYGIMVYLNFNKGLREKGRLTHSHTMTPFDAPGKQAF